MAEVLTGVQKEEGGGFFGIHTGDNKPRAQHESSVRKEADLISVRGPFADENLSSES